MIRFRYRHLVPPMALVATMVTLAGIGIETPQTIPPTTVPPVAGGTLPILTPPSVRYGARTQTTPPSKTPDPTMPSPSAATRSIATALERYVAPPAAMVPAVRPTNFMTIDGQTYPVRTYKRLLTPNDPFASQWWVTDAKLTQAWDVPAGNHQTLLAVIDSGVALRHEDLAGRWYTSPGESGGTAAEQPSVLNCSGRGLPLDAACNLVDDNVDGVTDNEYGRVGYENPSRLNCTDQGKPRDKICNLVDDDNNGYVDDVTGWDFVNGDNSTQAGEINPFGTGTTHGTRVAGVAAATGNNGVGIAGVDWRTRILPVQAMDDDDYGNTYSVGRAIIYAADQKADVISLSLGTGLSDQYVLSAVRYALSKGSMVVAAAGNDGCACMLYPAAYPEVVAVGAMGVDGQPALYSSYGPELDILAPGSGIRSTDWKNTNPTSAYVSNINGTSFAAPLVSGLLTRLKSQRPSVTQRQLLAALTETTSRMALASTSARTDRLGFGKADAAAATQRMLVPRSEPQVYQFEPVSRGDNLTPQTVYDGSGAFSVTECAAGRPGTTSLYWLAKADREFYSVSRAEMLAAQQQGYAVSPAGQVCVAQPHDTPGAIRRLDLYGELRNYFRK